MNPDKDYYRILGVLDDAEDIVIRAAYRALAQRYHPDKWQGDAAEATRRMAEINEAYAVLSDAAKRAAYDVNRDKNQFQEESSETEDANDSITKDWEIATKYLPELRQLEQELHRISRELAFTFRLVLLEGKKFNVSASVAKALEENYFGKYFGDQPEVQAFAKELILEGRKDAAKELNEVIRVLGRVDSSVLFRIARDFKTKRRQAHARTWDVEMVVLPRGSFLMGSADSSRDSEMPRHTVRIDYDLAVGKYPITFEQWDACMADGGTSYRPPDNGWGRGSRPVINVSWDDCQAYLRWLNKVTGNTYRLLSEAEWEYAARAGISEDFPCGADPAELGYWAWFAGNSGDMTHPVGEKRPNAFGLYDMHGNVWEWTEDFWHDTYKASPIDGRAWTLGDPLRRVIRGGSFNDNSSLSCSTYRYGRPPSLRYMSFGFRVACSD